VREGREDEVADVPEMDCMSSRGGTKSVLADLVLVLLSVLWVLTSERMVRIDQVREPIFEPLAFVIEQSKASLKNDSVACSWRIEDDDYQIALTQRTCSCALSAPSLWPPSPHSNWNGHNISMKFISPNIS
jgi:hypothetical protein